MSPFPGSGCLSDHSDTMSDVARKIDFDDGSDDHISDEDKVCGVEGLRPLPESPEKLKENVMPPILTREAIDQSGCAVLECLHLIKIYDFQ